MLYQYGSVSLSSTFFFVSDPSCSFKRLSLSWNGTFEKEFLNFLDITQKKNILQRLVLWHLPWFVFNRPRSKEMLISLCNGMALKVEVEVLRSYFERYNWPMISTKTRWNCWIIRNDCWLIGLMIEFLETYFMSSIFLFYPFKTTGTYFITWNVTALYQTLFLTFDKFTASKLEVRLFHCLLSDLTFSLFCVFARFSKVLS